MITSWLSTLTSVLLTSALWPLLFKEGQWVLGRRKNGGRKSKCRATPRKRSGLLTMTQPHTGRAQGDQEPTGSGSTWRKALLSGEWPANWAFAHFFVLFCSTRISVTPISGSELNISYIGQNIGIFPVEVVRWHWMVEIWKICTIGSVIGI